MTFRTAPARVKVDRYLRVLDHPEIYAAGDLASVTDPRTGHVLPPLAQVALEEGETAARNLDAELTGRPLEAFTFHDKGFWAPRPPGTSSWMLRTRGAWRGS